MIKGNLLKGQFIRGSCRAQRFFPHKCVSQFLLFLANLRDQDNAFQSGQSRLQLGDDVAAVIDPEAHPLLAEEREGTRLIVLFTSDRGMAGSLNTNTIRFAAQEIANSTGGQVHSICQTDLGPTVQRIMSDVIGRASPIVLSERPISVSIAVAREDKSVQPSALTPLQRSRQDGFDYNAIHNSIVFFNQGFTQYPYEIVVSYERWSN